MVMLHVVKSRTSYLIKIVIKLSWIILVAYRSCIEPLVDVSFHPRSNLMQSKAFPTGALTGKGPNRVVHEAKSVRVGRLRIVLARKSRQPQGTLVCSRFQRVSRDGISERITPLKKWPSQAPGRELVSQFILC